jgi:hypothetical protein
MSGEYRSGTVALADEETCAVALLDLVRTMQKLVGDMHNR